MIEGNPGYEYKVYKIRDNEVVAVKQISRYLLYGTIL